MLSDNLIAGTDGRPRCSWAVGGAPGYVSYHDEEWGRPVLDDRLFERLTLEAFQSELSWLTILRQAAGVPLGRRRVSHPGLGRAQPVIEEHGARAALFWRFRPAAPLPPRSRASFVAANPGTGRTTRAHSNRDGGMQSLRRLLRP